MYSAPQLAQGPFYVLERTSTPTEKKKMRRKHSRGRFDPSRDILDLIDSQERMIGALKDKFKPKEEKKEDKPQGMSPVQLSILMMVFTPFIGMAYLGAMIMLAKAAMSAFGVR